MHDVCKSLERKIQTIKLRMEKMSLHKISRPQSPGDYIRQLPKVRSVLEEDAAAVRRSLTTLDYINKSFDQLK